MKHLFIEKEKELRLQMNETYSGLLLEFPLTVYWGELKNRKDCYQYEMFSARLAKLLSGIQTKHCMQAVALYHKIGMCDMIVESLDQFAEKKLPEKIRDLYHKWFLRIYEDFSTQPDFYYDYEKQLRPFRKDITICCGRAIPVGGAWVIEHRRISYEQLTRSAKIYDPSIKTGQSVRRLRILVKHTVGRFGIVKRLLKKLMIIIGELSGKYEWFYVIHTVEGNMQDFNQEQMNLAYQNIAALLQLDPRIKGVFRQSWFLDPHLKEISPNLSFLLEIPQNNGAILYYAGPCSQEEKQRAIKTSPVRSRLYQEGGYIPESYFYFWLRDKVIHGV